MHVYIGSTISLLFPLQEFSLYSLKSQYLLHLILISVYKHNSCSELQNCHPQLLIDSTYTCSQQRRYFIKQKGIASIPGPKQALLKHWAKFISGICMVQLQGILLIQTTTDTTGPWMVLKSLEEIYCMQILYM